MDREAEGVEKAGNKGVKEVGRYGGGREHGRD